MLNLPEGVYPTAVGSNIVPIEVMQERFASPVQPDGYRIGPASALGAGPRVALRTVAGARDVIDIQPDALAVSADDDEVSEFVGQLLISGRTSKSGEELTAEATSLLAELEPASRDALRVRVSKKLTARRIFDEKRIDTFHTALNLLIRRYMTDFGDFFAEEVTLMQLGSTVTRGILRVTVVDGEQIESVSRAGKIPPLMRRPWLIHPAEMVDSFRGALSAGEPADAAELLGVRALALLERGAARSAIIEASAALETTVARRIRGTMLANGASSADVDAYLREQQRFSDRCKVAFKSVIGRSLAEVDPPLWERVVRHRDDIRHKIAHGEAEPDRAASEQAVRDFLALAKLARDL